MTCDSSMIYDDHDTCMIMSFMPRLALNVEGGSGQVHMYYVCTGNYVVMYDAQVILPPFIGLEAVTANIIHHETPCMIKP